MKTEKEPQPMKPNIQTLYARILEDIRAQMDEAETLYLKLCRAAMSCMVGTANPASVSPGREIGLLSAQYREKLQAIIQDISTVYRDPIRVYPIEDRSSVLDMLETYNAQFEELERIFDRLSKGNDIPKTGRGKKNRAKNQNLWRSIMKSVNFEQEFQNKFDEAVSFNKRPNILVAGYTGCGKTSLIRTVLGDEIVPRSGISNGKPCRIDFDSYENDTIRLWDSRGLELGEKEDGFRDMMREFVSGCQDDPNVDEHIHLVWYLIQGNGARVTDCDVSLMKEIFTFDDVIAVISKKDITKPAQIKAIREKLAEAGVPEEHIVEVSDAESGAIGCKELVELSNAMLPAAYRDAFMAAQSIDREAKAAKVAEKRDRADAIISEAVEKAKSVKGESKLGDGENGDAASQWNDVKAQLSVVLVELLAKLSGLYGIHGREIRESSVGFVENVLSDAEVLDTIRDDDGDLDGDSYGMLAGALGHFFRNNFEAYAVARIRLAPLPGLGFELPLFKRHLKSYKEGMNMKPNILVCGKTGVGKTSLIQAVTHRGVVPDSAIGDGCATTQGFHVYETEAANFIDSEGMNPGTQSVDDYVDFILDEMMDRLETEDSGNLIHNVWYCIDGSGARVQETDAKLIRTFRENMLLVVTKSELMRKEQIEEMMNELLEMLPREQIVMVSAENKTGLAQLIAKARAMSMDAMKAAEHEIEAFQDRWQEYYDSMLGDWREHASEEADSYINWAAGRAAAIAIVPLPLVDIVPLVANETYMIYRLAEVYGIPVDDAVITMILGCAGGSIAGKIAASLLPILKIPIAAGITYAVGKVAQAYFESDMKLNETELREKFLEEEREAKKREWKPIKDEEKDGSED
jgi:predicted GTPase/uncharacterized protein (DUF697 family)